MTEQRMHIVRFLIDPAVVLPKDPLPAMQLLVAGLNLVLSKTTVRRAMLATNDPWRIQESTWTLPGGRVDLAEHEWPVTICIDYDPVSGHGWPKVLEDGSAGIMMKAPALYNVTPENADAKLDWEKQLHCIVHEFGHHCGAAIGEYYKLARIDDSTGVWPHAPVDYNNPDCPFWSSRQDMLSDPMLLFQPFGRFSDLTSMIVNGDFRLGGKSVPAGDLNVLVESRDDHDGTRLHGSRIRVWHQDHSLPINRLLVDSPGPDVLFQWAENESVAYSETARLVKVHADGYMPAALWISLYDLQKAALLGKPDTFTAMLYKPITPPQMPEDLVLHIRSDKSLFATGCIAGVTYELLAKDMAPIESVWRVIAEAEARGPLLQIADPSPALPPRIIPLAPMHIHVQSRIYRIRSKRPVIASMLAKTREIQTCLACDERKKSSS